MKEEKLLIFIQNELHISEYCKKVLSGGLKSCSNNMLSISNTAKKHLKKSTL